jgi:hypothetical protein
VVSPDRSSVIFNCGSRTDHGEVQDSAGAFPNLREEPLSAKLLRVPASSTGLVLQNNATWLQQNGQIQALRFGNKRLAAPPTATVTPQATATPGPAPRTVAFVINDYIDTNGDGAPSPGEGVPSINFTYRIIDANTDVELAATVSQAGSAPAVLVPPGSYKICWVSVAGYRNTRPGFFDSAGRACYWLTVPANVRITLSYGHAPSALSAAAARVPGEPVEIRVEPLDPSVLQRPAVYLLLLAR